MNTKPIGLFDSGVGGMTVFSEIIKLLPNENIIYYGDTKRFPYGNKSKDNIIELAKQAADFLISKDVKCIVIACGTATSQAIDYLQANYNIPIIGIIEPTTLYIKENTNIKNLGIIATRGTINSGSWENKIKEKRSDINIQNKACPLLADLAESGWTNNTIAHLILEEYLKDFSNIDALVLGCTHYPLFQESIKQILGDSTELINTGEKTAIFLKNFLLNNSLDNSSYLAGKYQFYLTDTESNFKNIANSLLNGSYNITEILKA